MSIPAGRIHIVGAGGAGMSAISKLLLAKGHEVSGSDLRGGATLEALADLDMKVSIGHNPEAVVGAGLVVASSAVPEYDEELEAARREGIEVWRRPRLLAAITEEIPTIGATGTHGKTTTTAMLITALRALGEDPSFIVGGDLVEAGTNGHLGEDALLVLEADEAFRTFESLTLVGLVVTNVEHEHVDHFVTLGEMEESFIDVVGRVSGPVLACRDDPGSARVADRAGSLSYGFDESADWVLADFEPGHGAVSFTLRSARGRWRVTVPQPGRHVALNAAGALALLGEIGRDVEQAALGLSSFRGVGRRWEHRGTVRGVMLYDDYAHHPTEVAAVLEAAASTTEGRIWAVFQPHLYSRTERFSDEFGAALSKADVVVVTDVFGARETPVPGVTGDLIAQSVRAAGGNVEYVASRRELAEFIAPRLEPGDLVISIGAGDITLLHTELAPIIDERA
jgi:UDP-N-acetylmuramate--alanine ligase